MYMHMCAVRTGENAYLKNDECWKKRPEGIETKRATTVARARVGEKHLSIFAPNELPCIPPRGRNSTETTFIVFVAI